MQRSLLAPSPRARRPPALPARAGLLLLALALSLLMLFPFFWMLTTALKSNSDIYRVPPDLFPKEFHWENFPKGMAAIDFGRLFFNSLAITVLSTAGYVASSMVVAYGLARIKFPGRKLWFYLFVGSMMLPPIVGLIPLFRLFLALGWYDTWLPLIVPAFLGNPLFIFLAHQFYLTIPRDLDEAAMLDGAGHWTIFTRIMVPLTRPVWITMIILAFQTTWNEYLQPLVYLPSQEKWPLAVGMATFAGEFAGVAATKWNQYMAANLLYMLPPLILFFCAQRYFVQGMSALGARAQK